MSSETRNCQNCKAEFVIEPEDFKFYEKIGVPVPRNCLECRFKQKFAFWPFGKFYRRKCDLTGEDIISIFQQKSRFPVYKTSNWYSDKWEPASLEVDLSRSFFDQMKELQEKIPRPHSIGKSNTNCDYADDAWESKNCYLSRALYRAENIYYSYRVFNSRDSVDIVYCIGVEQCYDSIFCFNSYNLRHCYDTRESFDSAFLYDCRNVNHCFMCWNLRHKEYHILNKPYSKEEYFQQLKEYRIDSYKAVEELKKKFKELVRENAIHKNDFNVKNVNSSGNGLTNNKNCKACYFVENSEDCKYIRRCVEDKDVIDGTGILKVQHSAQIGQCVECYNVKYSSYLINCRDIEYCDLCDDCQNCFGCVGLRKKQYCILNKQYSKEEYERLVPLVKDSMTKRGEYGEFLPFSMTYTGYNMTLAQIYWPETKESVEKLGGWWEEFERTEVKGIPSSDLSDSINDITDDVVNKIVICPETKFPFNFTQQEIDFYCKHSIPLPRFYPDFRTLERYKSLPGFLPYNHKCFFCSREIVHYYPPEFGYKKIACRECYLREVV